MRTALSRIRKDLKGETGQGAKKTEDQLTPRQRYQWEHMSFLEDKIVPRSYKEIITVGICIQLLTCYGVM